MLDTAAASIARAKVPGTGNEPIRLKQGLAEDLDAAAMFGRSEPFDTVFFSYCLSMVPTWPAAIEAALANLKPGGNLLIVDFWDQADLPSFLPPGSRSGSRSSTSTTAQRSTTPS